MDYFKTTPESPYHFSVGAVVIDDKGSIYANYVEKAGFRENFYTLMRETINPNETIEECLKRGLMEEMGIEGEIVNFLGSIVATDPWFGEINKETIVEKTTLYFLVKLISIDPARIQLDEEEKKIKKEIKVLPANELIKLMQNQFERMKANDLNESIVIERAKKYI